MVHFPDDDESATRPLFRNQQHYVLRDLGEPGTLFEKVEVSYLDNRWGAPVTTEQQTLHRAACGHVVVDITQIIACSLCRREVCAACQVRCQRCLGIVCNTHARRLGGILYCPRCRAITAAQKGALLLGVGTLRAVPMLARGLHRLFSKEF